MAKTLLTKQISAYSDENNYPIEALSSQIAHISVMDAICVALSSRDYHEAARGAQFSREYMADPELRSVELLTDAQYGILGNTFSIITALAQSMLWSTVLCVVSAVTQTTLL